MRTAQRAVEEHLGVGDRYSDDTEPMLMLAEVIAVHVDALDRLAALAETADSTSAAVGAIRSRVATANDLLGLLGLIGVTPATQNEWMYHQEVQTVHRGAHERRAGARGRRRGARATPREPAVLDLRPRPRTQQKRRTLDTRIAVDRWADEHQIGTVALNALVGQLEAITTGGKR